MKIEVKRDVDREEKNILASIKIYGHPACFDSANQYESWCEQESITKTKGFRRDICEDCTHWFKRAMIESKRCCNVQTAIVDAK